MNTKNPPLRKRSLIETGKLQHHYHRRKGSYKFIGSNFLKLGSSIAILGLGLFLINHYLIDIDALMVDTVSHLQEWQVYTVFLLSESVLGLLPPDFFILWAKNLSSPWISLLGLAVLSYIGGQVSFQLGRWINHIPHFHAWIHRKYEKSIEQFQKFGALVIVLGAMTPLPFSPISIISGSLEYSRKRYSLLALSRILRFFIYGYFLFKI